MIRLAVRLFRMALWLLPRRFRADYGDEMARVFEDACRDAVRARGRAAVLTEFVLAVADLVRTAVAERQIANALFAIAVGAGAAWFDQHCEPVGVIAAVVLVCAFVVGMGSPARAWRSGILIGVAIPVGELYARWRGWPPPSPYPWMPFESALALIPAMLGALLGRTLGRSVRKLA